MTQNHPTRGDVGGNEGSAGAAYAAGEASPCAAMEPPRSTIIVNADDWGEQALKTDRIHACVLAGAVSSTSAMVFMEDAERAAEVARRDHIDAGLHLNFTLRFSARGTPARLLERQDRVRRFLQSHPYAPVLYHPGLRASFEYLVKAQLEEYERLYGHAPRRVDGHHHMHLCANVLYGKLLPAGAMVRRNFTFRRGEKGFLNRAWRKWCDRQLARRYRLADYFFNLAPVRPISRLERIFALGADANVEIETHPINDDEYSFLMEGEFSHYESEVTVARAYILREFPGVRGSEGSA